MSRTKKGALIAFLLVAIAAGTWAVWHRANGSVSGSGPVTSMLAQADVHRLESGLTSQDPTTYKATWAITNTPPVAPAGTTIKIDASSLRISNHTGEVRGTGTIPGKQPVAIVIKLVSVKGQWLVGALEEVK